MVLNPIRRGAHIRKSIVKDDSLLAVDFKDTLQGKDTSKVVDLMPLVGTDNYPFRTKVNVKGLDPIAAEAYGVEYFDSSDPAEKEAFIKQQEFDFPLRHKYDPGFTMERAEDYNLPFIIQVAGCNFHDGTPTGGCSYCFVDNESNDGKPTEGKVYLPVNKTIESFQEAKEKLRTFYAEHGYDMDMKSVRVSGGEPTLALDWILNVWREIDEQSLPIVGQIDSNLSTGKLVDYMEQSSIYEPHTLEKLAEHPVNVLTAIKGTDDENLRENVQANTTIEDQIYSLQRFVNAGIEIFPQMYNPNPDTLYGYLEKVESEIENISLRIHIGPLKVYGPTRQRLEKQAENAGVDPEEFIEQTKAQWNENYQRGCEILDSFLRERHGVEYKEVVRSDVPLYPRLNNVTRE